MQSYSPSKGSQGPHNSKLRWKDSVCSLHTDAQADVWKDAGGKMCVMFVFFYGLRIGRRNTGSGSLRWNREPAGATPIANANHGAAAPSNNTVTSSLL